MRRQSTRYLSPDLTRDVAASLDREVPLYSAEESTRGQNLCAACRELVAVRLRMTSDVR
jgi:hypothetical protein